MLPQERAARKRGRGLRSAQPGREAAAGEGCKVRGRAAMLPQERAAMLPRERAAKRRKGLRTALRSEQKRA